MSTLFPRPDPCVTAQAIATLFPEGQRGLSCTEFDKPTLIRETASDWPTEPHPSEPLCIEELGGVLPGKVQSLPMCDGSYPTALGGEGDDLLASSDAVAPDFFDAGPDLGGGAIFTLPGGLGGGILSGPSGSILTGPSGGSNGGTEPGLIGTVSPLPSVTTSTSSDPTVLVVTPGGNPDPVTSTDIAPIPLPPSLLLLILAFGAVATVLRGRRAAI